MSLTIQQQVTNLFQQSLGLSATMLGERCYNDLLGLFQAERLQLKNMPTDFATTGNLLTFSAEVQSAASSTTTNAVLLQPLFKVNFCLFDVNGERQAVLLLNLSPISYLQNSNAPLGATDGPESLFDLYITLSPTNNSGTQMVYSSLSSSALTGTSYTNNFQSVVDQSNLKVGLNFPLSFTPNADLDNYINILVGGTNGAIDGYADVSVRENSLQLLSNESPLTIPSDTDTSDSSKSAYISVYQTLTGATLTFPPDSGASPAISLTLSNIGLGFPLANNDAIWPEVFMDGSVTLGSGASAVTLDIDAAYFLYHGVLALKFTGFPTLNTLLSSFCTPSDYFPDPFDALLDIELSDLEILIDIQSKSILEINLTVTADQSIDLIDGVISIQPTLTLQIQQPFDETNRKLEGLFAADWTLGSTTFDTYLTYPDYAFEAKMATGQTLDIDKLGDRILSGVTFPHIDISAMEVRGNFTQKSFAFNLTVDSDLSIPLLGGNVLKIEQIEMGMGYNAGQRTYELIGNFDLAGARVSVSANYDGAHWQFSGSSIPTTTIHFSDLFTALPGNESSSSAVSKITTNFPALEIDAISFSYNTGDKSFEFETTAAVEVDSTSYPFSFNVSRQKSGDSFSWKVSGKSDFQTPIALGTLFKDFIKQFQFVKDLTLPSSIANDLNIQSLSFSYDTSTDDFDCGFSLSDPPQISTVIGGDISTDPTPATSHTSTVKGGDINTDNTKPTDSSPATSHTFSTFTLKRTTVSGTATTKLNITIDKGLNLFNLVGLGSDLPSELDFTLNEIDFTITLQSGTSNSTNYAFSTTFEDDGHSFNFIGLYEEVTDGSSKTKSFGGTIYSSNGDALSIGGGFPIQGGIKDLFIAKISLPTPEQSDPTKIDTTAYTIFGSDLSAHADIDLSKLPVIGQFLTEAKFNFKSLRFVYAKGSLTKSGSTTSTPVTTAISNDNLQKINTFLGAINVSPLNTSRTTTTATTSSQQTFGLGFTLQGNLVLGDNAETIPLHTNFSSGISSTTPPQTGSTPIASQQVSPATAASPASATPVGKKFGPVTIQKIGLSLSGGKVDITFTGGLTMGPVSFDFIDLEVKSPVDKFDPSISLHGLSLDLKKPPLTLEGLFMESTIDVPVPSYQISTVAPTLLTVTNGTTNVTNQSYLTFAASIPSTGTATPDTIALVIANNSSAATLTINDIKCSGKDFAVSALTFPLTLDASNSSATIHVIFTPQSSGLKEGSIIIDSDDATVPSFGISLRGNQPGVTVSSVQTIPITAYNGSLSIGYKDYSLTAIGSYAKLPDDTITTFLYGFLGAPIGGPPFFFITGVAAGFGYNRAFTLPTAETVNTYPLIQPVMPDASSGGFNFDSMNLLFMPVKGEFWGAVGVRGETFKMVESFVLLDVQFKTDIEIDIIGLSHMQFPKSSDNSPGLAKINVGLVARIIPEMGIVAVNGAFLAGSYIMNPLAHISGGFALLGIFKDQETGQWKGGEAGDFVITIGGYATSYHPKPYYPQVSRLELNWQVSSYLSLKASAYFAITPQAMMAGGNLVANLQIGGDLSIHANFTVGADFIIYWKPYHYTADIYVDLDVTVSIHVWFIHVSLNLDLGADLNIFGPDFSGNGSVHVHVIISFSVHVSFGDGPSAPPPIPWSEFQTSLLPEADKILSGNISKGLVASQSSPSYNVVNSKELQLICESAIPIRSVTIAGTQVSTSQNHLNTGDSQTLVQPAVTGGTWQNLNSEIISFDSTSLTVQGIQGGTATLQYLVNGVVNGTYVFTVSDVFGIKPMAQTVSDITKSELRITATWDTAPLDVNSLNKSFVFEMNFKNMPAAIWKPAETTGVIPDQSGPHLLKNLCSGIKISAQPPTVSDNGFLFNLTDADVTLKMPKSAISSAFAYSATDFSTEQ